MGSSENQKEMLLLNIFDSLISITYTLYVRFYIKRIYYLSILGIFVLNSIIPVVFAQNLLNLPKPGTIVLQSPTYVPVLIKGMTINPKDPFLFDFIIDTGNTQLKDEELKKESERLVKYFLASLTIPKNDLWVNLSPYEKNRIVPNALGKTELGRDMLAQDYILKQLTASLLDPNRELGQKFWDKIYKISKEKYGTDDIPSDTFNKVWILPQIAKVYEHNQTVYIVETHLKVMLEEDYFSMNKKEGDTRQSDSDINKYPPYMQEIIREVIIPEIEKEVNLGQNFALIRQIYHSLILAKWYKESIKGSLLSNIYVDKNKIAGIENADQMVKDKIYDRYIEAFKRGVYNYIKEDYDVISQTVIPRKYFSGGELFKDIPLTKQTREINGAESSVVGKSFKMAVKIESHHDRGDGAMNVKDEYNQLKASLQRAFDTGKPEEERVAGLVGRRRFVKTEIGYEPVPMDGIAISYLIGRMPQDREFYNRLVDLGESFKSSLSDELRAKMVFLNPTSYHVTTVDIAALKKEYEPFRSKIQSRVAEFLQNMPAQFRETVKAQVVGIDMFSPGILKFKLEMDREFLDSFGRAIWDYLAQDPDLRNIYADVPFKPAEVTYHISLGYVMEPLMEEEIGQLVVAMNATANEKNHIEYDQSVGDLNGFSDMNTFFYLKDEKTPSNAIVGFEENITRMARSLGYQVDNETQFIIHLGDTVDQSKYYRIFNAGLKKAGFNTVFVPLKTMPDELSQRMEMFKRSKRTVGMNITSPHKTESIKFVDSLDENSQAAGSINGIIKLQDGTYKGVTSDGDGWVYWYTEYLGKSLKGRKIVILGAGGAARSLIVGIFKNAPNAEISIYDKSDSTAKSTVSDISSNNFESIQKEQLNEKIRASDIIINLTGSGKSYDDRQGEGPDFDYDLLKGKEAIDANYRFKYELGTNEFMNKAKASGAEVYSGLGFLVGTIPPLFKAFTDQDVDFNEMMMVAKSPESKGGAGISETGTSDKAVISDVGGIDMNEIDIKRQGEGVSVDYNVDSFAPILNGRIDGFRPVIINMIPFSSLPSLLGLESSGKDEPFKASSL